MSMKGKETMSKQNEKLVVGKLGSSYGIRGWLKVFPTQTIQKVFFDYSPWYIDQKGEWVEYKVEAGNATTKVGW